MKDHLKFRFISLLIICAMVFSANFHSLHAQSPEKNKVRINAEYVKIMDGESYFDIKASSRIAKKNTNVANIDIIVYNVLEDEKIELGSTTTNMKGKSIFVIKDLNSIKTDSTNTYNILFSFKGNDAFKKVAKSLSFKNAAIKANLITKDSINYITATLRDISNDSLISDESLTVQVQRLFQPLMIGEEFNVTDENGTIIVPIEEGIPGVDGNLNIEVVLSDSDVYGTVKDIVIAPVGIPIVDESNFDQRKMWSPRNKTPIFLLIFPNLIIFGMLSLIIYLTFNLYKISKSKN